MRELVFDPICAELHHRHVSGGSSKKGRITLVVGITRAFVETAIFGFPRYLHDRGRTTHVGRAVLAVAAGGLAVIVASLLPWLAYISGLAG